MFAVRQREALGKLGDPQAVPALIQALGDRWSECSL
jgi:HEAT repeat protein